MSKPSGSGSKWSIVKRVIATTQARNRFNSSDNADNTELPADVQRFLNISADAAKSMDNALASTRIVNAPKHRDANRPRKTVTFDQSPPELIGEGGDCCEDPPDTIVRRTERAQIQVLDSTTVATMGLGTDMDQKAVNRRRSMREEEGLLLLKKADNPFLDNTDPSVQSSTPTTHSGQMVPIQFEEQPTQPTQPPQPPQPNPQLQPQAGPSLLDRQHRAGYEAKPEMLQKLTYSDPHIVASRDPAREDPLAQTRSSVEASLQRANSGATKAPLPSSHRPTSRQQDQRQQQRQQQQQQPQQQPRHRKTSDPSPAGIEASEQSTHKPSSRSRAETLPYNGPPQYNVRPGSRAKTEPPAAAAPYTSTTSKSRNVPAASIENQHQQMNQDKQENGQYRYPGMSPFTPTMSAEAATMPTTASTRTMSSEASTMPTTVSTHTMPTTASTHANNNIPQNQAHSGRFSPKYDDLERAPLLKGALSLSFEPEANQRQAQPPPPNQNTPALANFKVQMSHAWKVFKLASDRDGPVSHLSPQKWLRAAVWWFVCARAFFENLARKRSAEKASGKSVSVHTVKESMTQQLLQGHVDLAKAVWVLDQVIRHGLERDRKGSDPNLQKKRSEESQKPSGSLTKQCDALQKQMEALARSMERHSLMPPTTVLMQGLDQLMWVSYPAGLDLSCLSTSKSKSEKKKLPSLYYINTKPDKDGSVFEPLAIIPLADSKIRYCLFRGIGSAALTTPEGNLIKPMHVIVSLVRHRSASHLFLFIAGQIEAVSIILKAPEITFGTIQNPASASGSPYSTFKVKLPAGNLEVILVETEAIAFRTIYDTFMKAIAPLTPLPMSKHYMPMIDGVCWPEEILWEHSVSVKVDYARLANPESTPTYNYPFPFYPNYHERAICSVISLANRSGIRLCIVDAEEKMIQVLALNIDNPTPMRLGRSPNGITITVATEHTAETPISRLSNYPPMGSSGDPTWLVNIELRLPSSTSYEQFEDVLNSLPLGLNSYAPRRISLDTFQIEPFSGRHGSASITRNNDDADQIPCSSCDLLTEPAPTIRGKDGAPMNAPGFGLRLLMVHNSRHLRVTLSDRIIGAPRFRLSLGANPVPEIEMLRHGSGDLGAVIQRPLDDTSGTPKSDFMVDPLEDEWRFMLEKSYGPTLRLYKCKNMEELHVFQNTVTGWTVKYDGQPRSVTFPKYSTIKYAGSTEKARRPTISLRPFHTHDKAAAGTSTDKKAPVISYTSEGENAVAMRLQILQLQDDPEQYAGLLFLDRKEATLKIAPRPPAWILFGFKAADGSTSPAVGSGLSVIETGAPSTFGVSGKKGWLHRDKDAQKGGKDEGEFSTSPHVAFSLHGSPPANHLVRIKDVSVRAPGSVGRISMNIRGLANSNGSSSKNGTSVPNSPHSMIGTGERNSEDNYGGPRMNGSSLASPSNARISKASDTSNPPPHSAGMSSLLSLGQQDLLFSVAAMNDDDEMRPESDQFVVLEDPPEEASPTPGAPAGTIADVLIGFQNGEERRSFANVLPS